MSNDRRSYLFQNSVSDSASHAVEKPQAAKSDNLSDAALASMFSSLKRTLSDFVMVSNGDKQEAAKNLLTLVNETEVRANSIISAKTSDLQSEAGENTKAAFKA